MDNLAHLVERLRSYEPRACVTASDRSYTYTELLREVDCWQSRFNTLGISSGSVIGLRADYSLFSVAALLALFMCRATVALIPRNSNASYLEDAYASGLLNLDAEGAYQWEPIVHSRTHPLLERLHASGSGGIIIFTSGTASRPKAALQSIDGFLSKFRGGGRSLRTLALLLLDHVGGLDTLFYTLANGGSLVFTSRRDPGSILELVELHRIEVLPGSPSFLRMLCAAGDAPARDLSSLKVITYGSEPMDATTLARLNERFPDIQISQKYGTTETGSPRTVSRGNDSLWLKMRTDGVETKIVDGVLWIRSQAMMLGYLNAPSPIDDQGWYCTGDLVEVEGEWMRILGRDSDIINVGGQKVVPTEVEQTILELDFVRDALVCGEPHALMGAIVTAQVALSPSTLDAKESVRRIRSHCRGRLASYKVPVKIDVVADVCISERQKARRSARKPA